MKITLMTLITLITSDDIVLSDSGNSHFRPRKMRELIKFLMYVMRCISQKK